METKKYKKTGEYNKKEADLTDTENKLMVSSGGSRVQYRAGEVGCKDCWMQDRMKGVLYNTGNIASIL